MTMIDKVAQALFDARHGKGAWDNPGLLPDERDDEQWREMARAAIEAMREEDEVTFAMFGPHLLATVAVGSTERFWEFDHTRGKWTVKGG